jgi:hypothetical protein
MQEGIRNGINCTLLHPDMWLNTTETVRSCIAKGTYIDIVRDVSKYPKGILIENVKAGDLIYFLNDKLIPTISKVLWAGKKDFLFYFYSETTTTVKLFYTHASILSPFPQLGLPHSIRRSKTTTPQPHASPPRLSPHRYRNP